VTLAECRVQLGMSRRNRAWHPVRTIAPELRRRFPCNAGAQ